MSCEQSTKVPDGSVYLLGQPPIRDFIQFVTERSSEGLRGTGEKAASLWRDARCHLERLQDEEAGIADHPPLLPIPDEMRQTAEGVLERPEIQGALRYAAHTWNWIEIDRLVVYQRVVNLRYAHAIAQRLPDVLDDDYLIRMAIGSADAQPPVKVSKSDGNDFVFSSPSSDVRFLNCMPVNPADIQGLEILGRPAAAIVVFVGGSTNYFSAVHHRNRLVLHNGTHRLYALRARGVTHAPCLVAHAVQPGDIELVGHANTVRQAAILFESRRPPLFKDYFDARLHTVIPTTECLNVLRLELKLHKDRVPLC